MSYNCNNPINSYFFFTLNCGSKRKVFRKCCNNLLCQTIAMSLVKWRTRLYSFSPALLAPKCAEQLLDANHWTREVNEHKHACKHAYKYAEECPAQGRSGPEAKKRSGKWGRVKNLNTEQSFSVHNCSFSQRNRCVLFLKHVKVRK